MKIAHVIILTFVTAQSFGQAIQSPIQTISSGGATGNVHPSSSIPTHFSSVGQPAVMPRPVKTDNGGGVMVANELMFGTTALANVPSAQPTNLNLTRSVASINVQFTHAPGPPDGYVILRKAGSAPTAQPAAQNVYPTGFTLGDATVIFSGSGSGQLDAGLNPETTYYYTVFAFNGSGTQRNYLLTSPLTGSATTFAVEPIAQPTGLQFVGSLSNRLDLSWNASSSATEYIVLRRTGSSPVPGDAPVDGTVYTMAGSSGSSTVAYIGPATIFNDTGLSAATLYYYDIYAFNGSGVATNYLTSIPPLEADAETTTPPVTSPTSQPTNLQFTNISPTGANVSFTAAAGNPDGYIVLRRIDISPGILPVDGTTYGLGPYGLSVVVHVGNTTSFVESNLSPAKPYFYDVFAYNGSGTSINYLETSPLEDDFYTLALEPASPPTNVVFSNGQLTPSLGYTVSFTPATVAPTGYIVLRRPNESPGQILVDGVSKVLNEMVLESKVVYIGTGTSFIESNLPAGTYHYDVLAFNGNGETINYLNSNPAEGSPDISPPTIVESNPTTKVNPPENLPISVDVSDPGSGVFEAWFEYRSVNALTNALIRGTLTKASGNTWTGTILASSIGDLGVEYKVYAANNHSFRVETTTRKVVVEHEGMELELPVGMKFERKQSAYRMVAIPLNLDDATNTVNEVFGEVFGDYDPEKWRMYHYAGRTMLQLNGSTLLSPGVGYWLISTVQPTKDILIDGTTIPASWNEPFEIPLVEGWNQIGNPYPFNIAWSDVLDANPTLVPDLSELPKSYEGNVVERDKIDKFTGVYVSFTGTATTKLKIPVARDPSINSSRKRGIPPNQPLASRAWQVTFNLSNGMQDYVFGGIGMHEDASDGIDQFDDFSIPRFFEYLELNHPKRLSDLRVTRDIVRTSSNMVWNFTTETNQVAQDLHLTWDNSYFGNGPQRLWLLDVESGRVYDMRKTDRVNFSYSEVHRWKAVYGDERFVQENTLPDVQTLVGVFPNPFTNETTIEFTVPDQSFVTLDAHDMTGRRVRTLLNASLSRERYRVRWDGTTDAGEPVVSGMYIIRLTSDKGASFLRIIRK